jgi:alpha-N-acetylglucosamine transferase
MEHTFPKEKYILNHIWNEQAIDRRLEYLFWLSLFSMGAWIALATVGFNNWPNIFNKLVAHEKSKTRLIAMLTCKEIQKRLSAEQTIDNVQ